MSNVIKAAAVTYTQEIRTIDSNLREGGFTRLAVEKHAQVKEDKTGQADGFEPGIVGLFADRPGGGKTPPDQTADEAALAAKLAEAEQMKKEAEGILADARAQAKDIVAQAEKESERIRKQAYSDGLRQGEEKAGEKYDALKARLEQQVQEAKDAYEKQIVELEPAFVNVLIQLLQKLTGVLLEDRREIVAYLMEQAMREIEPDMNYLIHVSPEDFALASSKKGELVQDLKEGAAVEVVEDRMMQKGQCIIETDSRIFDCGVDTQLKNLVSDLKMLAGSREG